MGKMFFVDLTLCTACRGCQVACKQWKNLPAEKTRNQGSHQNPPDLSFNTLKTVHFKEVKGKDGVDWLFFPEQCRHCIEPPCMYQADVDKEGAVIRDEDMGAVLFTPLTKEVDGEGVRAACPYDIPRANAETKELSKCDMCADRVSEGKLPSCVLACNTGCMHFGDEQAITDIANKRLAEVKKEYPDAVIGDADSVRVLYLFKQDPKDYAAKAVADTVTRAVAKAPMTRRQLLRG